MLLSISELILRMGSNIWRVLGVEGVHHFILHRFCSSFSFLGMSLERLT